MTLLLSKSFSLVKIVVSTFISGLLGVSYNVRNFQISINVICVNFFHIWCDKLNVIICDMVRFPAQPQVGKLVVACHWSAVYSTQP